MFLINGKDFSKYGKYILVAIIVIIVVVGFIFLYCYVISRNRMKKQTKDLEKRYGEIHDVLTTQVAQSITRICFISQRNMEYVQMHEKYMQMYNTILQNDDKQSYIAINSLKNLIFEKKYHGLKNIIDSTRIKLNEFNKAVDKLDEELVTVLQRDLDCRQKAVALQREYRDIKEEYQDHIVELKSISTSFNKVFEKIEKSFADFEELSNAAKYDESEKKLPTIAKVLDALKKSLVDLPSLCALVDTVLPKRIEDLQTAFEALEEEDYPLHHLKVNSAIEEFNNRLQDLHTRLLNFNIENVKKEVDEMQDQIVNLLRLFDVEKDAKVYFDQNCEQIYNETYNVERQFMKLKRILPSFKDIYKIKDYYLDEINDLQNDINNLGNIKRDLDTYIHSGTRQPFSILDKKLKDLQDEMGRIKEVISSFHVYLDSLKSDTEFAYGKISEYFLKLKNAEYIVRNMNVPSFTDTVRNDFNKSYQYLENIGEIVLIRPIDVEAINDNLNAATSLIEELIKHVNDQAGQLKYAEESIVYANQYRQEFYDVRQVLNRAEKSFMEGDFTRTIDETVKTIKKMRPDVNAHQ